MTKIKDLKIYTITIVISLALIITIFFDESTLTTVFSGIGCSGIAASVMAIFLDKSSGRREEIQKQRIKRLYFNELNSQLSMMIGRALWFAEKIDNANFDWTLDNSVYLSLAYMCAVSNQYSSEKLPFSIAIERLKSIGAKYSYNNMSNLIESERQKVYKLFSILSESSNELLRETLKIKQERLLLETENYLSLSDNEKLMFDIALAVEIMSKKDKNYEVALLNLIDAAGIIRMAGGFTNEIFVHLQRSVRAGEI